AIPAVVRQVENDAIGILVFDLVESVRIVLRRAAEISGAGIDDFLGRFIEVVDPHAEMHEAEIIVRESGNLTGLVFQQRDIDRAVWNGAADAGPTDRLHPQSLLSAVGGLIAAGGGLWQRCSPPRACFVPAIVSGSANSAFMAAFTLVTIAAGVPAG